MHRAFLSPYPLSALFYLGKRGTSVSGTVRLSFRRKSRGKTESVAGPATEPLLRGSGHEAGNAAGFATGRLTVERAAQLVECDADSLQSLELRTTYRGGELPSEVEWNEENIAK